MSGPQGLAAEQSLRARLSEQEQAHAALRQERAETEGKLAQREREVMCVQPVLLSIVMPVAVMAIGTAVVVLRGSYS